MGYSTNNNSSFAFSTPTYEDIAKKRKKEVIEFVLDKIGMSHRSPVSQSENSPTLLATDKLDSFHATGSYDDDGTLLCGVLYHNPEEIYPGYRSVDIHVAGERRGFTREFITESLHYPFVTLGCVRVVGRVLETNERARRFAERVGCQLDGIERTGIPELGNICIYTMLKSECKFLDTKE